MAKKTTGLGRGLGALIPEAASAVGATRAGALEIPLSNIKPNPYQPRTEFSTAELAQLAESIREHGVLQPVVVEEGAEWIHAHCRRATFPRLKTRREEHDSRRRARCW